MARPAICCWNCGSERIWLEERLRPKIDGEKGSSKPAICGRLDGEEMIGDCVFEEVEPEGGDLGEDLAFVGNAGAEHMVECGDAVGRDKEQVVAQCVDVADLAAGNQRKAAEAGREKRFCHSKTVHQLRLRGGMEVGCKRCDQRGDGGFGGFEMGRQAEVAQGSAR